MYRVITTDGTELGLTDSVLLYKEYHAIVA